VPPHPGRSVTDGASSTPGLAPRECSERRVHRISAAKSSATLRKCRCGSAAARRARIRVQS
jgi:hypothetical protein